MSPKLRQLHPAERAIAASMAWVVACTDASSPHYEPPTSFPLADTALGPSDGSSLERADAGQDAANQSPPPQTLPADAIVALSPELSALSAYGFVPSPQRAGDPERGYRALIEANYLGCGMPQSLYGLTSLFGAAPSADLLPERTGINAAVPYYLNAFETDEGVALINNNCLLCHAARLNGELVMGLGSSTSDFTHTEVADLSPLRALLFDPLELAEFDRWYTRLKILTPHLQTLTVGASPADRMADVLFAYHDPITLAWRSEPVPVPAIRKAIPTDVPPWWRAVKKHRLYYTGSGVGDHARLMMVAAVLCTDSVEEARAIDEFFPDIRAFINSIEPPPYPHPIEPTLSARGEHVFAEVCARCHGSYGDVETYPNLYVELDALGTDRALADGAPETPATIAWMEQGFYNELAQLDPKHGYGAPPLDGIWATAPFLHNGSVPSLATLLDSPSRPTYWTRSYRDDDLDYEEVGFRYQRLTTGHAGEPDPEKRRRIYDTTEFGYGNGGHTYGDGLSTDDRKALIEYLKSI